MCAKEIIINDGALLNSTFYDCKIPHLILSSVWNCSEIWPQSQFKKMIVDSAAGSNERPKHESSLSWSALLWTLIFLIKAARKWLKAEDWEGWSHKKWHDRPLEGAQAETHQLRYFFLLAAVWGLFVWNYDQVFRTSCEKKSELEGLGFFNYSLLKLVEMSRNV